MNDHLRRLQMSLERAPPGRPRPSQVIGNRNMPQWVSRTFVHPSAIPPPPPPADRSREENDYEEIGPPSRRPPNHPAMSHAARQPARPAGGETKERVHCDLCGSSASAVRCDKCSGQVFCLSCDDMYHRHPKRSAHVRKAVDSVPRPFRPPLPPKSELQTPPVPPPRRNKRFGLFGKKEQSPALPRKESASGVMGSLKRFMGVRPLPPPPSQKGGLSSVWEEPGVQTLSLGGGRHPTQRSLSRSSADSGRPPSDDASAALPATVADINFEESHGRQAAPGRPDMVQDRRDDTVRPRSQSVSGQMSPQPWMYHQEQQQQQHDMLQGFVTTRRGQTYRGWPQMMAAGSVCDMSGVPPPPPLVHHHAPPGYVPHMMHAQSMAQLGCPTCHGPAGVWMPAEPTDPQMARYPSNASLTGGYPAGGGPFVSSRDLRQPSPAPSGRASRARRLARSQMELSRYPSESDDFVSGAESDDESEPTEDAARRPATPTAAWHCQHCTFQNSAGTRVCSMCCRTQPPPPPPAQQRQPQRRRRRRFLRGHMPPGSPAPAAMARGRDPSPGGVSRGRDPSPGGVSRGRDPSPGGVSRGRDPSPGGVSRGRDPSPGGVSRGRESSAAELTDSVQAMKLDVPADRRGSDVGTARSAVNSDAAPDSASVLGPPVTEAVRAAPPQGTGTTLKRTQSTGTSPPPQNIATQTNDELGQGELYHSRTSLPRSGSRTSLTPDYEPFRYASRQLPNLKRTQSFQAFSPRDRDDRNDPWCSFGTLGSRFQPRSASKSSVHSTVSDSRAFGVYTPGGSSRGESPARFSGASDRSRKFSYGGEMARKPADGSDYLVGLEEMMMQRNQDSAGSQGMELVLMLRDAEKHNFSPEDLQIALNHCGERPPVPWLLDNLDSMIETVCTLATNYGHERRANDVGTISNKEARDALRVHKGNVWTAVTECVEQRRKKYAQLAGRGSFSREDIITALTANHGNVEAAYLDLNRTQLKPFLMRIWGPPQGVEVTEGAPERPEAPPSAAVTTEVKADSQAPAGPPPSVLAAAKTDIADSPARSDECSTLSSELDSEDDENTRSKDYITPPQSPLPGRLALASKNAPTASPSATNSLTLPHSLHSHTSVASPAAAPTPPVPSRPSGGAAESDARHKTTQPAAAGRTASPAPQRPPSADRQEAAEAEARAASTEVAHSPAHPFHTAERPPAHSVQTAEHSSAQSIQTAEHSPAHPLHPAEHSHAHPAQTAERPSVHLVQTAEHASAYPAQLHAASSADQEPPAQVTPDEAELSSAASPGSRSAADSVPPALAAGAHATEQPVYTNLMVAGAGATPPQAVPAPTRGPSHVSAMVPVAAEEMQNVRDAATATPANVAPSSTAQRPSASAQSAPANTAASEHWTAFAQAPPPRPVTSQHSRTPVTEKPSVSKPRADAVSDSSIAPQQAGDVTRSSPSPGPITSSQPPTEMSEVQPDSAQASQSDPIPTAAAHLKTDDKENHGQSPTADSNAVWTPQSQVGRASKSPTSPPTPTTTATTAATARTAVSTTLPHRPAAGAASAPAYRSMVPGGANSPGDQEAGPTPQSDVSPTAQPPDAASEDPSPAEAAPAPTGTLTITPDDMDITYDTPAAGTRAAGVGDGPLIPQLSEEPPAEPAQSVTGAASPADGESRDSAGGGAGPVAVSGDRTPPPAGRQPLTADQRLQLAKRVISKHVLRQQTGQLAAEPGSAGLSAGPPPPDEPGIPDIDEGADYADVCGPAGRPRPLRHVAGGARRRDSEASSASEGADGGHVVFTSSDSLSEGYEAVVSVRFRPGGGAGALQVAASSSTESLTRSYEPVTVVYAPARRAAPPAAGPETDSGRSAGESGEADSSRGAEEPAGTDSSRSAEESVGTDSGRSAEEFGGSAAANGRPESDSERDTEESTSVEARPKPLDPVQASAGGHSSPDAEAAESGPQREAASPPRPREEPDSRGAAGAERERDASPPTVAGGQPESAPSHSSAESGPTDSDDSDSQPAQAAGPSETAVAALKEDLKCGRASALKRSSSERQKMQRRAGRLLRSGRARSQAEAEMASQLMALQFAADDSLQAAAQCSSLYAAIGFLHQECELCAGRFSAKQMVSMTHCTHRCCRGCAQAYFTQRIKERPLADLRCPFCDEPDLSNEETASDYFSHLDIILKTLVTTEIHGIFHKKLFDRAMMKDPNFKWCPKCSSGFIAAPRQKKLHCPDCGTVSCALCTRTWTGQHEGVSCEQFALWQQQNDPEYQSVGLERHLALNGISCPACRFRYSLAKGGCMHFTCSQCKYEFCSGCGRPFSMGSRCGQTDYCARLGLHAHHPRNCLFYLRDKEPQQLQQLLKSRSVAYDTEPPSGSELYGDLPRRCRVQEQKETADGLRDDLCGRVVSAGQAGLCRMHYVEYLAGLVWQHRLDPVAISDAADLRQEMRRHGKRVRIQRVRESDEKYTAALRKIVETELPLDL